MTARAALVLSLVAAACGTPPPADEAVARVGAQVLGQDELAALLEQAVPGQDTLALRQAIVEQWVSNALLYEAAVREGVLQDEAVREQVEQNTRAIVVAAYLDGYFEENAPTFGDAEVQAYFAQHAEGLRLREPYLSYRLFGAPTEAEARRARAALTARAAEPDTLWRRYTGQPGYTVVPLEAGPERGLYATLPEVRDALLSLGAGQVSGIVEADGAYYVAQVVERVPEGGTPRLAWVRPEIEERLRLEARKQMARRHVQALRAQALARGALTADTLQ